VSTTLQRASRRRRVDATEADGNRRRQLLRASARLFREKGYDGTSVRDIAQATGMQSGSWVYHFATKQDILEAVMREGLVAALARIEFIAAQAAPPRATFEQLVRAHLETLLGPGQDFIPVVLYEWRSLEPAARRKIKVLLKRYEAVWQEVIAALQQSGDWPGGTRIDALLLFGALNWIARWYDVRRALDVDALASECIRFFLREPLQQTRKRAARPPRRRGAS
jgi:TetR/AcrR family transcriptional regulator, cholesterol catabolism regulator